MSPALLSLALLRVGTSLSSKERRSEMLLRARFLEREGISSRNFSEWLLLTLPRSLSLLLALAKFSSACCDDAVARELLSSLDLCCCCCPLCFLAFLCRGGLCGGSEGRDSSSLLSSCCFFMVSMRDLYRLEAMSIASSLLSQTKP